MSLFIVASLLFLAAGIAVMVGSFFGLGNLSDRLVKRYPYVSEFVFGCVLGAFAAIVPAALAFALTHKPWVSFLVGCVAMIGCGLFWARVASRR